MNSRPTVASPGTENPWELQGIADLAISVLRAVLVQPQWSLPLLTHMCSQLKSMNAAELASPALVEQVASLAVLGGHLLRPRLGQRVDTEKSNKGIITAVRNAKSNLLEVDIRYSPTENTSMRLSAVDVRPDGDGSLADLQLAIARAVPPSSASELLTAIVKLLEGLNEQEKATAQSKLHSAHYLLKLQASQALHVLLRQPSTAEAFIGLGTVLQMHVSIITHTYSSLHNCMLISLANLARKKKKVARLLFLFWHWTSGRASSIPPYCLCASPRTWSCAASRLSKTNRSPPHPLRVARVRSLRPQDK